MAGPGRWRRLRDASRSQFGLATTEQAAAVGITLDELVDAVAADTVWVAGPNLWALDNADKHMFEDWAATWMSMNPDVPVPDRRRNPDIVISHEAAAVIRDLGTVNAYVLTVTTATRPPVVPPKVEVYLADPGGEGTDWTIVDGLPVATPARILADLAAEENIDGSHLGTVVEDIIDQELLPVSRVAQILQPHTRQWTSGTVDDAIALLIESSTDPSLN